MKKFCIQKREKVLTNVLNLCTKRWSTFCKLFHLIQTMMCLLQNCITKQVSLCCCFISLEVAAILLSVTVAVSLKGRLSLIAFLFLCGLNVSAHCWLKIIDQGLPFLCTNAIKTLALLHNGYKSDRPNFMVLVIMNV